jgi:cyclohexanecarboxylate-CoA ligase
MDTDARAAFYRREGWWRDSLVVDDLQVHARTRGDEIAQVTYSADGGWSDRLTFAELAEAVDSIATGLLELGVKPGEPVCFQLPNWWHFTAVHLACNRIGAISCPLIPILRRREVEYVVGLIGARVYIVPSRFRRFDFAALAKTVLGSVDSLEHVFTVDGPRGSGDSFERHFLGRSGDAIAHEELAARHPGADDVATIQFTSGTTGEPKGVMHTHNSLHATTKLVPWGFGLDSSDVVMMPSPLAHASGFLYGVLMPVTWGMKVVYQDLWDARRMLELLDAEGGTWTIGSPPFVMDTIRACRELGRDAAPLRLFSCAGAPIPRYLAEETPRVTGARLVPNWGLTETGAATIVPISRLERAADSDGVVSPAMQVRIVDDAGVEVPNGTSGRLLTRGASQFLGYFKRPKLTRAVVDDDGWLDTGDLASIDDEGFVSLTGRAKDIVIRGGENIPVVAVEAALYQHQAVREVAIVGIPDERMGERACAIVVPKDGFVPTLADLVAHLDALGFAKQFWPERLELAEVLPRTPAGKVQKFRLQQQLLAGDGDGSHGGHA